MAESVTDGTPTLAEHYSLEKVEKVEKPETVTEPLEVKENTTPEEVVPEKIEESPAATAYNGSESTPAAAAADADNSSEAAPAVAEEISETTEVDNSGDQDVVEETAEIKLETAPADFRFPTTNQTRHCFTRYVEFHRCIAAKGEGAPECDKFSKYYRALCPGEWVERWNEQRENGTFPGPL